MAAFVACCRTCHDLSPTLKTRRAHDGWHEGHELTVVGGRWIDYAGDLAPLLPEEFLGTYWEQVCDRG